MIPAAGRRPPPSAPWAPGPAVRSNQCRARQRAPVPASAGNLRCRKTPQGCAVIPRCRNPGIAAPCLSPGQRPILRMIRRKTSPDQTGYPSRHRPRCACSRLLRILACSSCRQRWRRLGAGARPEVVLCRNMVTKQHAAGGGGHACRRLQILDPNRQSMQRGNVSPRISPHRRSRAVCFARSKSRATMALTAGSIASIRLMQLARSSDAERLLSRSAALPQPRSDRTAPRLSNPTPNHLFLARSRRRGNRADDQSRSPGHRHAGVRPVR